MDKGQEDQEVRLPGEPSFCLNDFRKWMENQVGSPGPMRRGLTGTSVEPKIPFKRLLDKIDPQEGELEELARDFKNGGVISEVHGSELTIKVDSGSFVISKAYVRRS